MAWLICAIPAYTTSYSYDGQTLTNDGTWSYSWQHGRQLKQMSRPDASGDTEMIRFRYDSGGHRIGKDSGVYHASYSGGEIVYAGETTRTSYSYLGDTLTQVNIDAPTGSTSLHFTYDELGPMSVTYDGAEYFYLKNAQGDVTGLVNSSGTQVVAYTYDAWGNPLPTTGTMADTLGKLNPFRYRGYVYDAETGLYYIGSRYYNPETGRFINADNSISNSFESVHGYNLFAYCFNNPVNMNDSSGSWPKWLEKVAKVVAVAAVVVTAAIVVAVATAGTGGLGLAAAGVAFGTACGGLVGGVANERKGKSFINGWAGGTVNGFTQSLGTVTLGPAGTIIGGSVGSGAGTFITESLNNTGLPNGQKKSSQEIVVEAINASIIGAAMSAITAGIGHSVDFAQGPHGYNSWAGTLLPNVGIAPITPGFGEMLKGFFGVADDAMAYQFCE